MQARVREGDGRMEGGREGESEGERENRVLRETEGERETLAEGGERAHGAG
jgi:hypothetical protein